MRRALVTGIGRSLGIGTAVAAALRDDGWHVVTTGWRPYDKRMEWGADEGQLTDFEVDLSDPEAPDRLFADVQTRHGSTQALILCHTESVAGSLDGTTIESFDRHFAVNTRASWLLIRAFASQFSGNPGSGRIVALTSDHTAFNVAYGASKGALDRIVQAAAVEYAPRGITANLINPGPTDNGWMTEDVRGAVLDGNLSDRLGTSEDCARLVRFLCSAEGAWINAQLLHSNGGLASG